MGINPTLQSRVELLEVGGEGKMQSLEGGSGRLGQSGDPTPAGSSFRAILGIAFFEGVAWVERGFESGTKSKYLWIVLETSSHPSPSCHTAMIGRFCSSLLAGMQEGSREGVVALSSEIIAAAMGLMLCAAAESCRVISSFCQPLPF